MIDKPYPNAPWISMVLEYAHQHLPEQIIPYYVGLHIPAPFSSHMGYGVLIRG